MKKRLAREEGSSSGSYCEAKPECFSKQIQKEGGDGTSEMAGLVQRQADFS